MTEQDEFTKGLLAEYETAAGKAALIELKLRILAEVVPELEQHAHVQKLEDVESVIVEWFAKNGEPVDPGDVVTLATCRRFRNKLLHGDFHAAREKMHELGAPQQRGGVRYFNFSKAPGDGMFAEIEEAVSGGKAAFVADAAKTTDVGIGIWLAELSQAGDFQAATQIFRQVSELVDALIDRAHGVMIKRRRPKPSG